MGYLILIIAIILFIALLPLLGYIALFFLILLGVLFVVRVAALLIQNYEMKKGNKAPGNEYSARRNRPASDADVVDVEYTEEEVNDDSQHTQ